MALTYLQPQQAIAPPPPPPPHQVQPLPSPPEPLPVIPQQSEPLPTATQPTSTTTVPRLFDVPSIAYPGDFCQLPQTVCVGGSVCVNNICTCRRGEEPVNGQCEKVEVTTTTVPSTTTTAYIGRIDQIPQANPYRCVSCCQPNARNCQPQVIRIDLSCKNYEEEVRIAMHRFSAAGRNDGARLVPPSRLTPRKPKPDT
ncbi:hypothetical protein ANCCEY_13498 [Ancylostoma ceylanicum]|uniref:EB domain-containing protein n=1 Tax=Ancylostoma ceylanicum TaxID=53326 RepID=A0A0D6L7E2_9BILA|nr:hypothetical protein ANCCEY_13498 [Ancylostoma ceylanicum]